MVEKAQADSKQHVDDTKDNRHLHLKGVEEGQFIGSNVPNLSHPKKTEGITNSSQMEKYLPTVEKVFFLIVEILNIHTSRENNIRNSYVPMA